jgi:aryl-alcohol dehydrogenase-like predicted oxidoreductase
MSTVEFGHLRNVGKPVSRILYGTARKEIMLGGRRAFRLLDEISATGITAFDTARAYPGCERTLGRWMHERRNRATTVILSKGAHPLGSKKRVNAAALRTDVATSLKKLRTDHIDIYVLHRDDESQEVAPIVDLLNELHEAGTIGAFGASNWTHQRIQAANSYAKSQGLIPFTVSSPNFGLADQVVDPWGGGVTISGPVNAEARDWYRAGDMPVIAWSSMGRGFFSGGVKSDDPTGAKKLLDRPARTAFLHAENFERLRRVEELAAAKGCTTSQLALAWIFNQGLDVYAVVTASSRSRMNQNIDALHIKLSIEEAAYLDLRSASLAN